MMTNQEALAEQRVTSLKGYANARSAHRVGTEVRIGHDEVSRVRRYAKSQGLTLRIARVPESNWFSVKMWGE